MSGVIAMSGAANVPAKASDPDWWRGSVIYQIYPRSFQDTNGDGVGDLAGITQRLEHVASLGVDGIWLSPFFTSPMKDFGYDVSNYKDVDPIFGTLEDFERMMEKAHGLGLKVVIDQVLSHTSDKHPWFQASRHDKTNAKADWYVWADPKPDGTPPNNWLSIFGGSAWTWDSRRMQYYLHNFLASQPDLNFHNPAVRAALLDACKFWLDLGVDGFRLDTVNFYYHSRDLQPNPPISAEEFNATTAPAVNPYNFQNHLYDKSQKENLGFLKQLRALLDKYDATTTVGEVGDAQRQLEIMSSYTSGGDKLHMAYTFDFLGGSFEAPYFRDCIAKLEAMVGDGWPCWAFSNHDVVRHMTRWAPPQPHRAAFARLCASVLLTLRGSVCVYQGEELALGEAELAFDDLVDPYGIEFWPSFKGRDGCRTPMVWQSAAHLGGFTSAPKAWLPVAADHFAHAVDVEDAAADSILNHYRRLIGERRNHPALQKGSIELVDAPATVFAHIRRHGNESLLCAFNMSAEPVEFVFKEGPLAEIEGFGEMATRKGPKISFGPYEGWIGRIG